MRVCERVGTNVATGVRDTPLPSSFTRCSHGVRSSPLVATIAKSATSPSGTASLVPCNRPSAAWACSLRGSVAPGRSAKAKVPIVSPAARRGNKHSFCASLPKASSASVARQTEDENGTGAKARPSSSASTQTPSAPSPAPPNASGIAAPVQPMPAISFHSFLSYDWEPSRIRRGTEVGQRSWRNRRASSRNWRRSSGKSKFIAAFSPREPVRASSSPACGRGDIYYSAASIDSPMICTIRSIVASGVISGGASTSESPVVIGPIVPAPR
jgi:hypothetical protein